MRFRLPEKEDIYCCCESAKFRTTEIHMPIGLGCCCFRVSGSLYFSKYIVPFFGYHQYLLWNRGYFCSNLYIICIYYMYDKSRRRYRYIYCRTSIAWKSMKTISHFSRRTIVSRDPHPSLGVSDAVPCVLLCFHAMCLGREEILWRLIEKSASSYVIRGPFANVTFIDRKKDSHLIAVRSQFLEKKT